jgi:putative Mg2+ transporter-C (MgtC) family protein
MNNMLLVELCERLGMALLIGAVIGVERHLHDQPAGLRTHVLVALAAALSVLVVAPPGTLGVLDAQSRVIQGLMTGVGFIGAGVILHSPKGHKIHGLTTAAAIWITAAFGALCGAGGFTIALLGLFAVVLALTLGGPVERSLRRRFGRKDETGATKEPAQNAGENQAGKDQSAR